MLSPTDRCAQGLGNVFTSLTLWRIQWGIMFCTDLEVSSGQDTTIFADEGGPDLFQAPSRNSSSLEDNLCFESSLDCFEPFLVGIWFGELVQF